MNVYCIKKQIKILRRKKHFLSGRISTAKGPKVICDLTFWVCFTISTLHVSQKSIIELRNTLGKIDSQDTAPGILKFSDLLNLKFF